MFAGLAFATLATLPGQPGRGTKRLLLSLVGIALALDLLVEGGAVWAAESACCRVNIASWAHVVAVVERVAMVVAIGGLLVANRERIRRLFGYVYWSPAVLRFVLVLDLLVVAALFGGRIGAQSEDLVERWVSGDGTHAMWTVFAYLLFVAAIWLSAHRAPKTTHHDKDVWLLLIGGVVLSVAGLVILNNAGAGNGAGLLVLGIILTALAIIEMLVRPDADPPLEKPVEKKGTLMRGPVAALPALAIGLVLVRASANQLVVDNLDSLGLGLIGLLALAAAWGAWMLCVSWRPADGPKPGTEAKRQKAPAGARKWFLILRPWAAGVLTLVVLYIANDRTPEGVGVLGLLVLALAGVAAVVACIRAAFPAGKPLTLFKAVGFDRTPMVTLAIAWIVVASAFNGSSNTSDGDKRITYYDARVVARADMRPRTATPECSDLVQPGITADQFCTWIKQRIAEPGEPPEVSLVLVTASGGGVRAAAWTETVLDCLFLRYDPAECVGTNDVNRWDSLYAANGASGGSVGIASTVAERLVHETSVPEGWVRDHLDVDALAPAVGRTVLHDTMLGLFGIYAGHDRAHTLETAWFARWDGQTAEPYCGDKTRLADLGMLTVRGRCEGHVPLMLFNGTDVSTGRRVNLAPPYLTEENDDASAPFPVDQFLAGVDGAQDLPVFTAAFLSARFPFITPTGRLPSCLTPEGKRRDPCPNPGPDGRVLNVVDGGYAENSGTAQVAALWDELETILLQWNSSAMPKVRPVLVEIENGELSSVKSPTLGTGAGEFMRPIQAITNVYTQGRDESRLALREQFTPCDHATPPADDLLPVPAYVHFAMYEHPGRVLPLGWTLSPQSLDDVRQQLDVAENREAAACFKEMVAP